MPLRRTIATLQFDRAVGVVRAPDGEVFAARMAAPRRTRRGGDLVVVRFDDDSVAERFAIAVSPRGLSWHAAIDADGARRVMLYRVREARSAAAEMRRVMSPQRRDAMFKADLIEPGQGEPGWVEVAAPPAAPVD